MIAAGNFSITAALAKHFALIAARYLPSWEIIDYAGANKIDAPSGTVQELAEALGQVAHNELALPVEGIHGPKEARGPASAARRCIPCACPATCWRSKPSSASPMSV